MEGGGRIVSTYTSQCDWDRVGGRGKVQYHLLLQCRPGEGGGAGRGEAPWRFTQEGVLEGVEREDAWRKREDPIKIEDELKVLDEPGEWRSKKESEKPQTKLKQVSAALGEVRKEVEELVERLGRVGEAVWRSRLAWWGHSPPPSTGVGQVWRGWWRWPWRWSTGGCATSQQGRTTGWCR